VPASTSSGAFLTFGRAFQRRPITVAGPWPIFTAFQHPENSPMRLFEGSARSKLNCRL